MDGMVKKKQQEILVTYEGPKEVRQDKKILRNVLLNLLSNAVKYSPDGKSIYLSVHTSAVSMKLKVKDSGMGIPPEAQKELFSKFHRANNAMHIQGTGLGLHIVKRYVELLNGSIEFSSKENEGTAFTVELPMDN